MGDISELRGLVVVGSFIGLTVFLASLIPSAFLVPSYEGRTIEPPEYFEALELQSFAETWTYILNETGGDLLYGMYFVDVDIGGHDFDLYYRPANQSDHNIFLKHFWSEWIILPYSHDKEWCNGEGISRGTILSGSELDADYTSEDANYIAKESHFQVRVYWGFNETLYSSPTDAYDHHGLNILIGIDFDQVSTSYSAWDLIAMILFFGLPNVHWIIDAILHIPIWIAEAYIAFILILRAIGAIFGGGA